MRSMAKRPDFTGLDSPGLKHSDSMWCMTEQGRHDGPPGRPLWQAADRHRVEKEWSKGRLVKEIGISRVTFDRLLTQENPPWGRTVKRIADVIGMDYEDAMVLAGHPRGSISATLPALTGSFAGSTPVRAISDVDIRAYLLQLRAYARERGQTLGDVLVTSGLAEPEELKLTEDEIVREIENDDLPDDIRQEFLDGYRRLKEQVAESARRRESSG